ncbi:hypothetical protein TNCV_3893091 [Trichonephila clavipes]|nr:hypothetical protein TNCV_3893091 [Trichonephila clavipes]
MWTTPELTPLSPNYHTTPKICKMKDLRQRATMSQLKIVFNAEKPMLQGDKTLKDNEKTQFSRRRSSEQSSDSLAL